MTSISVIIPTYRRPQDLAKCLEALKNQTRLADEVLVVVRDSDLETQDFLASFPKDSLPLFQIEVKVPGQVAALNRGLESAKGDIISITDDDGIPHPPWLEKIEAHFLADAHVGGIGGRDWMYVGGELHDGAKDTVGRVQWWGRTIGNHHLGVGKPQQVEILKGANMSYRRAAIGDLRFDTRLLGSGAEVHNDRGFSLNIKKAGWKLIYDPSVSIDHHHGQRFDEDLRGQFNQQAWYNEVYNNTIVILDYLSPDRRIAFIAWSLLVGTRRCYGLVQLLRFLPKENALAFKKLGISIQGRWHGLNTWRNRETAVNAAKPLSSTAGV